MRSRCRRFERECSIALSGVSRDRVHGMGYIKSLAVSLSIVAAITILTAQQVAADAGAASEARGLQTELSGNILLAQAQSDDSTNTGDEKSSTSSGGTNSKSSSASERIRKYMGGDDGPATGIPGRPPGGPGPGPGRGPDEMGGARERMRERLQNLPPERREQIMQEIKEHRMRKRGMPDEGMDQRFMGGGPEGGPDGGPGPRFGGRRGVSEYGFKRGGRGSEGKGMKGGKFFGREPLDLTVLNLTAEQKAKIQSLRTADGQKSRQLQSELRQRREKLRDMLFDPAATSDQIVGTHREINKLQAQTQDIMLNDFLAIRKLLTKEQLELLPQVRPDESRRPSRLGQKPPPPPPPDGERPPRGDLEPPDR